MADDTISNDPRMREEARRAAAQIEIPKITFDPKTIAEDEYRKRIDPKYDRVGFEQTWQDVTSQFRANPPKSGDVLTTLTEDEFRQLMNALWREVQSLNLTQAGQVESVNARTIHGSMRLQLSERIGSDLKAAMPDLTLGVIRKEFTVKRTCLFHPDGCPDQSSTGNSPSLEEALAEALGLKKP